MSLSVRNKLILMAAMALVGIALVSLTSRLEMARVYTAASFANDKAVPAMLALDDAQTAFASQRVKFYQILVLTDAAQAATITRELQEARLKVEAAFKVYEPLAVDDKDRALLAALGMRPMGDGLATQQAAAE